MAIRNPNADEIIKDYDELQSGYVNDLDERTKTEFTNVSGLFDGLQNQFVSVGKGYIRTYANDHTGSGIMGSVFGEVPHVGFLYVVEIGSPRFLIATFCKLATTENPVVSILQSNGLILGDTNATGTQNIVDANNNDNVRMMAIHEKVF